MALSGDLNQPMEQSNTVYEDVTDLQYPENIGLNENAAYNLHSIDVENIGLNGNAAYNLRSIDVENIGLNGNAAYNLRSIDSREDIKSLNDDGVIYYCN